MRRWTIPAVLFAVAVTASAAPADRTERGELVDRIELTVPGDLARSGTPGAAVALVEDGGVTEVLTFGRVAGPADRPGRVGAIMSASPITADTVLSVASLSKPVAAWSVMTLVEDGLLDLDAPVTDYLTRWHFPGSRFDPSEVTVRRLLSHTGGVSVPGYGNGRDAAHRLDAADSLAGATGHPVRLADEPGTRLRYSGGGYTILQLLVEEVTGEPYAAYTRRAVLVPLGMADTGYVADGAVTGQNGAGEPLPMVDFTEHAAAGMFSTIVDVATFAAAAMPGPHGEPPGRGVLRQETVDLMMRPAADTGGRWGLGYQLSRDAAAGTTRLPGHYGGNNGFTARLLLAPERGAGLVVLTNAAGASAVIAGVTPLWIGAVFGDTAAHGVPGSAWLGVGMFGLTAVVGAVVRVRRSLRRRTRRDPAPTA